MTLRTPDPSPLDLPRRPQRANGIARYAQLLDAAEAILVRDGVEALTIQALAREAGVPMASVYHYFPGPNAVPLALSDRYREAFFEVAAAPVEGSDRMTWPEIVRDLIDRSVAYYRSHPYAQTLLLGSGRNWAIRLNDLASNRDMAPGVAALIRDKLPPMPGAMLEEIIFVAINVFDAVMSLSVAIHGRITDDYSHEAWLATVSYMQRRFDALQNDALT